MNAILLSVALAASPMVDVVDMNDGIHFAYRNLYSDTKPQECVIGRDSVYCRDMSWHRYQALAQFFGKTRIRK